MKNIKKVILSTLFAATAITNIATSATAQGYYPQNPNSSASSYNPLQQQPIQNNNPSTGGYNPPQQQPTQNHNAAFSPVGQWRCQEQYQDQNSTLYLETVMVINPNQQFEFQGSGTVQMANGMTSQIRSQGQGNWNTNNSGVVFTGQMYNTMNNGTFQNPIQAEYVATNQGTLTSQVNGQGAISAAICQRI